VPLTVVRDNYDGPRTNYGAHMILVRPDQYVAWTSDELSADPRQIVGRLVGRA
jgi:hypothetical protein